jgi:hypothetical protein
VNHIHSVTWQQFLSKTETLFSVQKSPGFVGIHFLVADNSKFQQIVAKISDKKFENDAGSICYCLFFTL